MRHPLQVLITGTRIAKGHLDSFVSASTREPFTSRIFVDTGDSGGPNALRTLLGPKPACILLRCGDLTVVVREGTFLQLNDLIELERGGRLKISRMVAGLRVRRELSLPSRPMMRGCECPG